jgi:hypothetical protein
MPLARLNPFVESFATTDVRSYVGDTSLENRSATFIGLGRSMSSNVLACRRDTQNSW